MDDGVGFGPVSAILGLLLDLDIAICYDSLLPGCVAPMSLRMDLCVCHHRLRALLHLLSLDELLLIKLLAVAQVVLLDRQAQSVVIVVTHRHLLLLAGVVLLL